MLSYPEIMQVKDVKSVMLSDRKTVADLLQKGWEPLNICKKVKRFLWWKIIDYSILFGYRNSPSDRLSCGVTTGDPSGHASRTAQHSDWVSGLTSL